jgi:hypothetical protein
MWPNSRFSGVFRLAISVTFAFILSIAIYGFLLTKPSEVMVHSVFNASFFPYSILIAFVILASALQNRDESKATIVNHLISPYLSAGSYTLPLLSLARASTGQLLRM